MILRIPEQLVVAFVRNYVIDDRCRLNTPKLQVHYTQGMLGQVAFAVRLPPTAVASLGRRFALNSLDHRAPEKTSPAGFWPAGD